MFLRLTCIRRFSPAQYYHLLVCDDTPALSELGILSFSCFPSLRVAIVAAPNIPPTTGPFPKTSLSGPRNMAQGHRHSPSPNQKHVPLSSSPAYIHIVTPSRTPSPDLNPFTRYLSRETANRSPFAAVDIR
ncbi:hypothetical protein K503DRAFT_301410 [Rhizopogon vinicolor AM-OR11-026]|uniref:Uncharacterized protein n=1 Tax=Rhizopogon vinicolor AM-OR11-026 TaxID=1314800 RepID=A0A1B7MUZ2_9AGAM|nr:hypothetical protein K503DRAFT_301410 [Rhizopogon vinicolor AM-OR11-026]